MTSRCTADVLARHDALEVVRLPHNVGAAGRNAGAERVHTPYVLFCDDEGWYERDGLDEVCDLFDRHPDLGLVNARILVGAQESLDPISQDMASSPLLDPDGPPGTVLMSFMAGAVAVLDGRRFAQRHRLLTWQGWTPPAEGQPG